MKIKTITHAALNSREHQAGVPVGWPAFDIAVDDAATLSPAEISDGWELRSIQQHAAIRAALLPAFLSWEPSWIAQNTVAKTITPRELWLRLTPEERAGLTHELAMVMSPDTPVNDPELLALLGAALSATRVSEVLA